MIYILSAKVDTICLSMQIKYVIYFGRDEISSDQVADTYIHKNTLFMIKKRNFKDYLFHKSLHFSDHIWTEQFVANFRIIMKTIYENP